MRKLLVIAVVALALASVAAVGKGWKWGGPGAKTGITQTEDSAPDGWTWDRSYSSS